MPTLALEAVKTISTDEVIHVNEGQLLAGDGPLERWTVSITGCENERFFHQAFDSVSPALDLYFYTREGFQFGGQVYITRADQEGIELEGSSALQEQS
ncbi:hypothetical protein SAMN05421781_0554 [Marinococcus luteus]|uniref:Uncharacterized protein n=1 Tax=Marinococcus luteus TaxID=1122204 RepID=A0A1H2R1L0_9BACI|nr:hypothetical protein [Marinococcus luteus]SDW13277.1 hypothetical protein SAMN05421781_0554 [Marinococcus luteus]